MKLKKEIAIRTIKLIDIGYITAIYFVAAVLVARLYDLALGEHDKAADDAKSTARLLLELIGLMWLFGVSTYIVRNLVELIPSPLNGLYGFSHKRVKELANAYVFVFIVLFFSYHLRAKLDYFYSRITGTTSTSKAA